MAGLLGMGAVECLSSGPLVIGGGYLCSPKAMVTRISN